MDSPLAQYCVREREEMEIEGEKKEGGRGEGGEREERGGRTEGVEGTENNCTRA